MSYAVVHRISVSRIFAIGLTALAALAISISAADARKKKARIGHGTPPPFSHIVLDAKTGKALEAFKADERRFPASLTKVMTLYLLFEQLEAGKLKLSSPLQVSGYAASRPPTKLGLKPGSTIRVDDAIKALVTKSANDAAVVIAEAIGGSEREFARMMTGKARSLGMSRTVYANASGLPDPRQVTTARDQAILGRAVQWHYPRQYKYFATNSFMFHGRQIRTHNRLLGQVKGVDGIKTGYTRASGFNLVTSVRRDRRHIVAVVLGGRTGSSRDAFMRKLISEYLDDASPARSASQTAAAAPADAATPPPAQPGGSAEGSAQLAASPLSPVSEEPGADRDSMVAVTTIGGDEGEDQPSAAQAPASAPSVPQAREATSSVAPALVSAASAAPAVNAAPAARDAGPPPPKVIPVAAMATAGLPMFPNWFPALLIVFIGCAGSLLSALWLLARRFVPRRRVA